MGQYCTAPVRASDPASNHFQQTLRDKNKNKSGMNDSNNTNNSGMGSSNTGYGYGTTSTGGKGGKGGRKGIDYAITPKSRFTGSGLGLKKNEMNEFNPQGSARMIIDQVLKKQIEEMGD
jgi:hypothetical protein